MLMPDRSLPLLNLLNQELLGTYDVNACSHMLQFLQGINTYVMLWQLHTLVVTDVLICM